MEIGEKIKQIRKQRKLTQKQLGEISGTSEITIRQYETNRRAPRIEQLNKIATALNVDISDLLGMEPIPARPMIAYIGTGKTTENVIASGDDLEFSAFISFIKSMGLIIYYDKRSLKLDKPEDSHWIVKDERTGKFFRTSSKELGKLSDSLLSFTKYQIYEILNSAEQVDESQLDDLEEMHYMVKKEESGYSAQN